MNRYFGRSGRALALAAFIVGGASAQALITMDFEVVLTGATPGGSSPWATLTIQDVAVDTVEMTLTHHATSSPGQFVSRLWMNIDPFPGDLAFSTTSDKISGHTFSQDGINTVGGPYDFFVQFNLAPPAARLLPGDSATWQVTGTGLTESSFLAMSPGGIQAMIHIQNIGPNGDSGHITVVPEPATFLAIGVGLAALAARRRKRS
jgi:hypothetical protein